MPASVVGLMKWIQREEWRSAFAELLDRHLAQACSGADIDVEDLRSLIANHDFGMLWGCAFEDFASHDLEDGRNVVDDYLKRRGWKESPSVRAYIAALRSSVMSLYEVSEIAPGESFLARDLVRGGDAVRVSEKTATKSLRQWDRIAARVLDVRGKRVISGAVLGFDHQLSEELLAALSRARKAAVKESTKLLKSVGDKVDNARRDGLFREDLALRSSAFLITNIWLGNYLTRLMRPDLPGVSNTDGDPLEFRSLHYPLAHGATPQAIRAALSSIPGLSQENDHFWNWLEPKSGNGPSPATASKRRTIITSMEDGRTVLGNIELKAKALTLSVNSRARGERGRTLLGRALTGLVHEPLVETQTIEQMMASRDEARPNVSSGLSPEDERAFIHQSLDDHYGRLLGEPIPALGDLTPEKAVKTAKGREKVIAWLKTMENHSAQMPKDDPMASYDFAWIWERLGLAGQRR